jgi:uncharacterized protein YdaU (DUF1376 family)
VYYLSEAPIPLDERMVFRLVVATTDVQREAVRVVLGEFFTRTDEGWRHARCDDEILRMRERQDKQREKANKRWHAAAPTDGNAAAMPRHQDAHATALKAHADAMPPTPTPTPTPNKEIQTAAQSPRKRGIERPSDVSEATWDGFIAIRKAKKSPLSVAALDGIRREASKASLSLEDALSECCARGWQGFKADWVSASKASGSMASQSVFSGAL